MLSCVWCPRIPAIWAMLAAGLELVTGGAGRVNKK